MGNFSSLYLHMYAIGLLSQAQMLVLYPAETSGTLATASAAFNAIHG